MRDVDVGRECGTQMLCSHGCCIHSPNMDSKHAANIPARFEKNRADSINPLHICI